MSNLVETYVDNTTFPASRVRSGMPLLIGESHSYGQDVTVGRKAFVLVAEICKECNNSKCGGYYIKARIINTDITTTSCYRRLYVYDNKKFKLIVPDLNEKRTSV